jgi:CheY-like chemotaxis protein
MPAVLVVDDDPICRIALKGLLEKLGLTVDMAGDGREALELAAHRRYAAIFMDCLMPEVDGYEAAWRIREGDTAPSPLIIATTSLARHVCLAAGMDHHIAKPVRLDQLQTECTLLGLLPAAGAPAIAQDAPGGADIPVLSAPADAGPPLTDFLEQALGQLPELWRAANRRDAGVLARIAQYLEPRATGVGADRVVAVCRRLADAAQRGDRETAAALEPELRRTLAETQAAVAPAPAAAHPEDAESSEPTVRVAIADDDALALAAIEAMVRDGERLELVGRAGGVEELVELVIRTRPDVAVVDFFMPDGGGPAAARRIHDECPHTRVVALTASDSPDAYLAMLRAGAVGLLVKGSAPARLVDLIHRAAERPAAV